MTLLSNDVFSLFLRDHLPGRSSVRSRQEFIPSGGCERDSLTKERVGMSNVILGFVILVMMVSAILLVFVVVFGGALLVFARSDKERKENPRFPSEGQQVADQKTV